MNALENKSLTNRPRLVLAHANADYARSVNHYFRRLGWETHLTVTGQEARQLTRRLAPAAVVLGTELPDESGWLTCQKLRQELPEQRVILVMVEAASDDYRFAEFVGASALVKEEDGIPALDDEVGEAFSLTAIV
ncbi:MAG TPA: response regulator [Gemmataceae bacterium]|jgi:DNA-binding response OmpR family regulator|nr:response regulator [Gemmataceae bacterium]